MPTITLKGNKILLTCKEFSREIPEELILEKYQKYFLEDRVMLHKNSNYICKLLFAALDLCKMDQPNFQWNQVVIKI